MKLITLNIWGGIVHEPLLEFVKKHSEDTDIFCFQEVLFGDQPESTPVHKARANIFEELSAILRDFNAVPRITASKNFASEEVNFGAGQAIFVRKNITIKESGDFYCYQDPALMEECKITGSVEWVSLEQGSEGYLVANLHGLWQKGSDKVETPERKYQAEVIKKFLDSKSGKKILCGDFNLNPNTESMALMSAGMVNHVKENNVTNTRSSFYPKTGTRFADYILTTPDIKVSKFEVLPDEVSDHLALTIEFE